MRRRDSTMFPDAAVVLWLVGTFGLFGSERDPLSGEPPYFNTRLRSEGNQLRAGIGRCVRPHRCLRVSAERTDQPRRPMSPSDL